MDSKNLRPCLPFTIYGYDGLSEKEAYEAPRAMRLGEMRGGAGACEPSGSGDLIRCGGNGNSEYNRVENGSSPV
jgi:hypothetical protein